MWPPPNSHTHFPLSHPQPVCIHRLDVSLLAGRFSVVCVSMMWLYCLSRREVLNCTDKINMQLMGGAAPGRKNIVLYKKKRCTADTTLDPLYVGFLSIILKSLICESSTNHTHSQLMIIHGGCIRWYLNTLLLYNTFLFYLFEKKNVLNAESVWVTEASKYLFRIQ